MDFENDIQIDETNLDQEWLNQPALALKYSNNWAKEVQKLQKLEEEIKLIRAELIMEVNADPSLLGEGIKLSVATTEGYYRTHPRHIELKEKIAEQQYNVNIAEIAKREISTTRKIALENLVKLLGLNYFSGPSVPKDLQYSSRKENTEKSIDSEVAKKVGKKLKRKLK